MAERFCSVDSGSFRMFPAFYQQPLSFAGSKNYRRQGLFAIEVDTFMFLNRIRGEDIVFRESHPSSRFKVP